MQPASTIPATPTRISDLNARLLGGFLRALRLDRGMEPSDLARPWFPGADAVEWIEAGRVTDVAHLVIGVGAIIHTLAARRPVDALDVLHAAELLNVPPACLNHASLAPRRWMESLEFSEVVA